MANEPHFDQLEYNTPFSISMWLKPDPSGLGDIQFVFGKTDDGDLRGIHVFLNYDNEQGQVDGLVSFVIAYAWGSA